MSEFKYFHYQCQWPFISLFIIHHHDGILDHPRYCAIIEILKATDYPRLSYVIPVYEAPS